MTKQSDSKWSRFLTKITSALSNTTNKFMGRFREITDLTKPKKMSKKAVTSSSTRKLSKLFGSRKIKKVQNKKDADTGDSGDSGSTNWIDYFTRDMLGEIDEHRLDEFIKYAKDSPSNRDKIKKLLKNHYDKRFFKQFTEALEKKSDKKQSRKTNKVANKNIKKIIKAAAKTIGVAITAKGIKQAIEYFKDNFKQCKTPQQLAHVALLGVLNVHLTGTHQPVIQVNWGNLFGIADYNQYHGFDTGGAPIDQADRIDFTFGDPLGLEAEAVISAMEKGDYYPEFIHVLENEGLIIDPETNQMIVTKTHRMKLKA